METKLYQTAKEFFKFLNNYEADIWIRGSRAYDVNDELVAEYNTKIRYHFRRITTEEHEKLRIGSYPYIM